MSAGGSGAEPNFFAARFSLRRSLRVFCGFCFCCFFGLSELLLNGTSKPSDPSAPARSNGSWP